MLYPYTESVLANHKIPEVQNGNVFAGSLSSSALPNCEYSVSDFLHLGFPAPFAGDPPAVVEAAAPPWVCVAFQVPPIKCSATLSGTHSEPWAALLWDSLTRAEAQTQSCLLSTWRPQGPNPTIFGCTEISTTLQKFTFPPASGK